MNGKNENSLYRALYTMDEKNEFQGGDFFFVRYMLGDKNAAVTPESRRKAYKEFRRRSGGREFASVPTMQKWFGIDGCATPRRSQIYEIIFYLNLGVDELVSFLTLGFREPSVQINDYTEAIFVYGLENGLAYEECAEMIQDFEQSMEDEVEICHSQNTQELLEQFQRKKGLPRGEFMEWMAERAGAFKGYSNTSLDYLLKFKRTICKLVRQDMGEYLNELLAETDYDTWRRKRRFRQETAGESIRKFIYANRKLSDANRREILRLVQCVYFEEDTNVRLLSAVFSTAQYSERRFTNLGKWQRLCRMTEKHLSDLLNVATQKERDIRMAHAEAVLRQQKKEDGNADCPEWIAALINENGGGKPARDSYVVSDALCLVEAYRKEHRRRCVPVQRSDLLPFVLYVAQHRYLESIGFETANYVWEDAKREFIILADQTLAACNMAKLSEKYELDALLLCCFQEDEMYSYSEMLEALGSA